MSRGKKLVKLAIDAIVPVPEALEGQAKLYEFVDEIDDSDPWIYFKDWQAQQECKLTLVKKAEYNTNSTTSLQELTANIIENKMSETGSCKSLGLKDTPKQENEKANSLLSHKTYMIDLDESYYEDSSVSWQPNKEDNVSYSTLENSKAASSFSSTEHIENVKDKIPVGGITKIPEIKQTTKGQKRIIVLQNIVLSKELTTEQNNIQRGKIVEISLRKGNVWNKRDHCLYCNLEVTNFSRHLLRKHKNEESVQKITLLKTGDPNRKHMFDLLRKQGNFEIVEEKNIIRPVQRPSSKSDNQTTSKIYLPCKYCKGIYKTKSLKRHAKSCFFNSEKKPGLNYHSEGQTLMAFTASRQQFLDSLRLKTEVFHTMQADRISFNGKRDTLICQYAENYLRKHKRPHIKHAVSNKIRELGRLLIPLQDIYGIDNMLEALKPENYDKVVAATRIISGYNEATRSFEAPSLAFHMRTTLLAICAAAKSLLLRKEPCLPVRDCEQSLKNIKRFAELVATGWKFSMGSLALKDLNEKHTSKQQTLPVTEDIIIFSNYIQNTAQMCMTKLKANVGDLESFKKLTETALAMTIVLNRKRVGDVQYTKLESYTCNFNNINQEECLNALTENEIALSRHFKRIVTIGKGSKPVPILFSKNLEEYIDVLLSVRKSTDFIPKENPFLFALTGSSKWVDGSTVLRKFAIDCGAKYPNTLTSSRLRKQIATVLQILNLDQTEMEQVAAFMGHTKKTHEEFYRLPQEVFQTAKIAKLLLIMEKGTAAENKGKTLNDIDLELEVWSKQKECKMKNTVKPNVNIQEQCGEDNHRIDKDSDTDECNIEPIIDENDETIKKPENKSRRGVWNAKQKSAMLSYFKKHVKNKIAPKKGECLKLIEQKPDLFSEKKWVQIKVFIYNTYK